MLSYLEFMIRRRQGRGLKLVYVLLLHGYSLGGSDEISNLKTSLSPQAETTESLVTSVLV